MYKFFEKGKLNYNCVFNSTWCQIILAIFTAMAFFNNKSLPVYEEMVKSAGTDNPIGVFFAKLNFVLNGYNLLCLLVVIGIVCIYKKFFSQVLRFDKTAFIVACLFAVIMLIGDSFKIVGTWDLVFRDGFQVFISAIYFIGYTALFYVGVSCLFVWLDKYKISGNEQSVGKITDFVFNKHPFVCSWVIILLAWSPYLIFCYPGSVTHDMVGQLLQFCGERKLTNIHPVFSTFVMGICLRTGQYFGSDNLGVFIYVLLQSLVFSAALAFSISQMRYFKVPIVIKKISLLFFAFYPMFPGYAQYGVKDTLFIALLTFYAVFFVRFIQQSDLWFELKYKIAFVVLSGLVCLTRPNGLHVIIISGIFFLFLKKARKLKIQYCSFLIILYVLLYCYSHFFIPFLGVVSTANTVGELRVVASQQTARYVKYHYDEVTPEEKEILSKAFDYDLLAEAYNPDVADPVSAIYRYPDSDVVREYWMVYFKQFLKHPGTYVQAIIHKSYGYFYPDISMLKYGGLGFTIEGYEANTGSLQIYMLEKWHSCRILLTNFIYCIQKIPGFSLFYGIGIYTWIIILMLAYLLRTKKYTYIAAYIPAILSLLICIASPANRYLRYYMTVIVMIPILIAYFLYIIQHKRDGIES